MQDIWYYIILAAIVLFGGSYVLVALAKGKLQLLAPQVKELIIQAEIWAKDEGLEKAGVQKMTMVVSGLFKFLPSWVSAILTESMVQSFCQNVYDLIQDKLVELCEEYRNKYLN